MKRHCEKWRFFTCHCEADEVSRSNLAFLKEGIPSFKASINGAAQKYSVL